MATPRNSSIEPSENLEAGQHRKLIAAGQVAFLPTGILTTLLGPMLPILSVRWGLNYTQAGNLFLAQFLSQLAGVQLSGVMLSRVGFRPAFLSGLLLMAGGASTLYAGSPLLGIASVGLYGLGLGLIIPTASLMVAEVATGSRSAAVSLLNFFWGVGAVLCSLLVAWAVKYQRLPLFLGAVAISLLLLAAAVRKLPFPVALREAPIPWREILSNPVTWLFAAVFFLYPGAETCVGGWIGSYVSQMSPGNAMVAATMPAFFWAALTAGRGLGGLLLQFLSERRVLQVAYALAGLSIAWLLRSTTVTEVRASAVLTGLCFATLYPIAVARLSQRFGVVARSVGAIMFSLAALGPAVLPWLVGMISQSAGNLRAGLAVPLVATVILFVIHVRDW